MGMEEKVADLIKKTKPDGDSFLRSVSLILKREANWVIIPFFYFYLLNIIEIKNNNK